MKKALAVLLSVLLLAVCVPLGALPTISVAAATSGTTGDCIWTLENGHLTISGEGEMKDYSYSSSLPWGTSITSVTIDDGVTTIGDSAFSYCNSLMAVTIGDSVTTIGISAFYNCTSLTTVTIGDSVTTIWEYAFGRCESLTDVYYGGSQSDSAAIVFYSSGNDVLFYATWHYAKANTSGITGDCTWTLDDNGHLTISGNGAMGDYRACGPWGQNITSVSIEDGVTSIGRNAFDYCPSLTSVTIGDSVTSIGYFAFRHCSSLSSVTFGNNVTTISNYSFQGCVALASLTLPDSVIAIRSGAFFQCVSLTSVTIPDSVTSIDPSAFYDCSSLTDVYYGGNEGQKVAISIGDSNDFLLNATWHYTDAPVCDHVYDDDTDPDCNVCGVLRWAVCPDTDVTIRKEDGSVLPAGTTITVDTLEIDDSDVDLDEQTTLVVVYDISLLLNGYEIHPDGLVAVTLPAPQDASRYTNLQVVYIDDVGSLIPCETVVNKDGTITFYTDHFSYYAIVGTTSSTPGDANGDGVVNNRDLALLQQYINKWDVTMDVEAMDVNDDGAVNNRDLALLQQYINKWDVELK